MKISKKVLKNDKLPFWHWLIYNKGIQTSLSPFGEKLKCYLNATNKWR